MRILIVDDTKANLYLLATLLKGSGYEVVTAKDGVEALAKLKGKPINMIISDILMPRMDGFQLCRECKKDDNSKNIPFIFYTATYTDKKDKEFALSLGAEKYINKPIDLQVFLKILEEVIEEHKKGVLIAPKEPIKEEEIYLAEYNKRLAIKLEKKVLDLEKANKKLREKEEEIHKLSQFQENIIDNANIWVNVLDKKANFVIWNKSAEKISGYSAPEVIGHNKIWQWLFPDEEQRKKIIQKITAIIKKGEVVEDYETTIRCKEGKVKVISCNSRNLSDPKGKIIGLVILGRDITSRKHNEKVQEILYNISKAVNSQVSLDKLSKIIHQELKFVIDANNFYIALADYKEDKLFFDYYKDEKGNYFPRQGVSLSSSHNLTSYVINTGQPLLANFKKIKELVSLGKINLDEIGIFSDKMHWLGVPLKVDHKIIGAMVVQNYSSPDNYTQKDIKIMKFVSGQIAVAIQRTQLEKELKELAHFDVLTNSYNRGYGLSLLDHQLKFAQRRKTPVLLAYADIDNLKDINDTFGHEEGDGILKEVVKLFKTSLREIDIICRMGGDEFLLIFPDSSLRDLPIIKDRISNNLIKLNRTLKKPYKIDLSMGISYYDPAHPLSMDELIRIADKKMYEDKKNKKPKKEIREL